MSSELSFFVATSVIFVVLGISWDVPATLFRACFCSSFDTSFFVVRSELCTASSRRCLLDA